MILELNRNVAVQIIFMEVIIFVPHCVLEALVGLQRIWDGF